MMRYGGKKFEGEKHQIASSSKQMKKMMYIQTSTDTSLTKKNMDTIPAYLVPTITMVRRNPILIILSGAIDAGC